MSEMSGETMIDAHWMLTVRLEGQRQQSKINMIMQSWVLQISLLSRYILGDLMHTIAWEQARGDFFGHLDIKYR